jgi:hypothetical protein
VNSLRRSGVGGRVMAGTTMAELQELGAWKVGLMVKRYAHFAPDQLRAAAAKFADVFATVAKSSTAGSSATHLIDWLPDQGSNLGPAD